MSSVLRRAIAETRVRILHNHHVYCCVPLAASGARTYKKHLYPYLLELYARRVKAGLPEVIPRNKKRNWNYDVELHAFSHRISEKIPGPTLMLAFTDKLYALQMKKLEMEVIGDGAEEDGKYSEDLFTSNEQLSNLGRPFTCRYIEEYLVSQLPHLPSTGIIALVDYLTSMEKLSHVGKMLGIDELVLYDGHPVPDEAVVRSLLALINIIKDERGVASAQRFVRDFLVTQLIGEDIDDIYRITDGMAKLEQLLSRQQRGAPEPRLIDQFGQETLMSVYYVGIYSDQKLIGKAAGESPEVAKEMAARDALMTIYGIQDNKIPFDFDQEYRQKLKLQSRSQPLLERSA